MGCGCGKPTVIKTKPKSTLRSSGNFSNAEEAVGKDINAQQLVQVEYMGSNEGNFSIRSRIYPGKAYRFGNNMHHKIQTVFLQDAEYLISQVDGTGVPLYRMIAGGTIEQRDPSSVLGRAVAV